MIKYLAIACAAMGLMLVATAPSAALNLSASAAASPASFSGACPKTITFNGTITATNWAPTALRRVDYKWIRDDGANAPIQSLTFATPAGGTQTVSTTWTLGASHAGWEAVQIVYPQAVVSAHANFSLACSGVQPTPAPVVSIGPGGGVSPHLAAFLWASPREWPGPCPETINFKGRIRATNWSPTALRQVQYKFVRDDGANSPVQTLTFPTIAGGTQLVSTTWTLGITHTGWEAIQILYPQSLLSNKAGFALTCPTRVRR